jgi:hypothetical protein
MAVWEKSGKDDPRDATRLPKHYFKAEHLADCKSYSDEEWIRMMLLLVKRSQRLLLSKQYSGIYKSAFDEGDVSYQRDGIARSAANTFLRQKVFELKEREELLIDQTGDLSANEYLALCRVFPDLSSSCEDLLYKYYKKVLKLIPEFIAMLDEPEEHLQLHAVKVKASVITEIDNPVDKAVKLALSREPELVFKLKHPSEYAILCAAKSKAQTLRDLNEESAKRFRSYLEEGEGLPSHLRDVLLRHLKEAQF